MAQGPDPLRHPETDRDNSPDEIRSGGGLADPKSTRLGLPSSGIALIAVVLVLILLVLLT